LALLSLWLLPTISKAQLTQLDATGEQAREVRLQLSDFENAWNKGDIARVVDQYHPSVDIFVKSEHWGYAKEVEYLASLMKKPDRAQLRFQVDFVRPLTSHLTVVNGSFHLKAADGSEEAGPFTAIWMRSHGRWQCIYSRS